MEQLHQSLTPLDELYLQRAYELAARGIGSTSPNPPVGAVVVRENRIVGEGYHHRAGDAHAEANALRQAARDARGATLYVSLEPCRHTGRTPPCTLAVLEAGIVRVVAGTLDPTPRGGADELRERGIDVAVAQDPIAADLIESFARAGALQRPYVALKMAMSLDGAIASRPGVEQRLTSEDARRFVRELRIAHDAVMVGAGTVRVDDPRLTVRPPHHRLRPYVRVVLCQTEGVSARSRIFDREEGYAKSLVLAPAGLANRLDDLRGVAEVIGVGPPESLELDPSKALEALRAHGIYSVLCEGGPTLAARLIAAGQVDRFYWAVAPLFLQSATAVPALAGASFPPSGVPLRFDRVQLTGEDVIISGTFANV
ncbi:MAG TPA: bifunctional diaminohydroxyphosphoribosylaminopyrimidine deaminase/5-amino-6-(5-phosphoribosylamino)uracil reductase RibD [Candidatus Cybelea sp.]|nr:bifunctional diaminohydroxyphosphoribosylaminopyrimidine deaminase/5-amino-6-(5-phosphoribosylamino)uracil reductase RibD [Candidatus Cybelea sp.]